MIREEMLYVPADSERDTLVSAILSKYGAKRYSTDLLICVLFLFGVYAVSLSLLAYFEAPPLSAVLLSVTFGCVTAIIVRTMHPDAAFIKQVTSGEFKVWYGQVALHGGVVSESDSVLYYPTILGYVHENTPVVVAYFSPERQYAVSRLKPEV